MKKLLVVLGLLVLLPVLAFAQGTYYVEYFANNAGLVTGALDQGARIINVGTLGTPLTRPVGDICINFYVFNADQEMIECCSIRITPNELFVSSVLRGTANPVTSVVPSSGVIKTVLVPATGSCDPTVIATTPDASLAAVSATHLQVTGGFTFVTETPELPSPLSAAEEGFLQTACSFTLYLGSGRGNCLIVPTD